MTSTSNMQGFFFFAAYQLSRTRWNFFNPSYSSSPHLTLQVSFRSRAAFLLRTKTLPQLTFHIGPFFLPLLLFLTPLFFQLAYKWLILNLRLLYQAGRDYLDCLLAVGWRFPSLWRQHGSHSRHDTLKPLYGFHCKWGHPDFLTWVWLDFEKTLDGFLILNFNGAKTKWLTSNFEFYWNCQQSNLSCVHISMLNTKYSCVEKLRYFSVIWSTVICCENVFLKSF